MSDEAHPQTLPFTYDRSDFAALARLGRPPIVPWLFRISWVLFALAFFLIFVCWAAGSNRALPFILVLLVLLVLFLALHRFGPNIGAWALERAVRREGLHREQRLTVADDCFRAESSRGKTEVRWSAIPRIHADEGRLFVFSTRRQAFIIPIRAFGSREEFQAFVSAAQERWKSHHRL